MARVKLHGFGDTQEQQADRGEPPAKRQKLVGSETTGHGDFSLVNSCATCVNAA